MAIGGITPSYGFLKHVLHSLSIPVFALIRPRSGNFTYSDAEFDIMKQDIILSKKLGVAGIVSGVLQQDNSIDIIRTKKLIDLASPLPFTFHRAFDWTPQPIQAIKQLIAIGAKRVLTSGQSAKAELGIELLNKLQIAAHNKIIILPGSGINSDNVTLFQQSGFKEIHASATTSQSINAPKVSMNSASFLSDSNIYYSDLNKIKSILKHISDED